MKKVLNQRNSERGGAATKLVIVLLLIVLIANAGYHFIPVAYAGESLKQDMQTAVVQGQASSGGLPPVETVKRKINLSIQSNNIPLDADVEVRQSNGTISAHVAYTQEISVLPFGIYNYQYEFDHTATPVGFLTKQ